MIRRISVLLSNQEEADWLLNYMKDVHKADIMQTGKAQKVMLFPSEDKKTVTTIVFFETKEKYDDYIQNHLGEIGGKFKKDVIDTGNGKVIQPSYACYDPVE